MIYVKRNKPNVVRIFANQDENTPYSITGNEVNLAQPYSLVLLELSNTEYWIILFVTEYPLGETLCITRKSINSLYFILYIIFFSCKFSNTSV